MASIKPTASLKLLKRGNEIDMNAPATSEWSNSLIQFTVAPSDHVGFPLLAEKILHLPTDQLPIIEYGRSRAEIYERVFGFARFHATR
jgi:hypothetical protein